jgi:hypothetical protein
MRLREAVAVAMTASFKFEHFRSYCIWRHSRVQKMSVQIRDSGHSIAQTLTNRQEACPMGRANRDPHEMMRQPQAEATAASFSPFRRRGIEAIGVKAMRQGGLTGPSRIRRTTSVPIESQ